MTHYKSVAGNRFHGRILLKQRGRHVQWIVPLKKRNSINNFDNNISVLQEESPVVMRAGVSTDSQEEMDTDSSVVSAGKGSLQK